MILIKGSNVRFELSDGSMFSLPPKYGMFHDPEKQAEAEQAGTEKPRVEQVGGVVQPVSPLKFSEIAFGPYETTDEPIELTTKSSKEYFGRNYSARKAIIDIPGPDDKWRLIGHCVQLFYQRPAGERPARYKGRYYHKIAKKIVEGGGLPLLQCGNYFKLEMSVNGNKVIYDYRGIVYP